MSWSVFLINLQAFFLTSYFHFLGMGDEGIVTAETITSQPDSAASSLSGLWALSLTMAIVLVRHFRWVSSFWISVQIDSVQSINRIFSDFCLNCVWLTSQKIKILSIFIEYHSVYPTKNLQIILQLLQMLIQKHLFDYPVHILRITKLS